MPNVDVTTDAVIYKAGTVFTEAAIYTAASMAPSYSIKADWNRDGGYSHEYSDITADVQSFKTRFGRDFASQIAGQAMPGSTAIGVVNNTGKYSVFNATSPLYGLIQPGVLIKIDITYLGYSFRRFTGRISSVDINVPNQTASIIGQGMLADLTRADLIAGLLGSTGDETGDLIAAILDAIDYPLGITNRALDIGDTTTGRWYVESTNSALEACRQLEETEFGFFYDDSFGRLVYESRNHRLTGDHIVSKLLLSDAGDIPYLISIDQANPIRDIWNEATVEVSSFVEGALAVLWTLREASNPTLLAGETKTYIAKYPSQYSGGYVGAYVNAWTTPVVGTDITQTGVSNSDIAVIVIKSANTMIISITNNHATATATLTLVQARGTPVTKQDPVLVRAIDADSQTKYQRRVFPIRGKWLPDTETAQNAVNSIVARYKDMRPILTVSVPINFAEAQNAFPILERMISDRISIEAEGILTQLGIASDFFIEAIEDNFNVNKGLQIKFDLSLTWSADLWILGTSTLGETTYLGY